MNLKLTELIVKHYGSDRVMNFLYGAWIIALGTLFGWWGILISFIIALSLSFVKEYWFDENFEWYDILAAFIGGCATTIIYIIITTLT